MAPIRYRFFNSLLAELCVRLTDPSVGKCNERSRTEHSSIDSLQLLKLAVPMEILNDVLTRSCSHAQSQLTIERELAHGGADVPDDLLARTAVHSKASRRCDLGGRSAEVEADDGAPCCHGFETDPAPRVVKTRMNE